MDERSKTPRILVVQAEAAPGVQHPWIPVGMVRWRETAPMASIIVKLTLSWRGEPAPDGTVRARLCPSQEPLTIEEPSLHAGAGEDERFYPSDFVPRKGRRDVMVVGHARAEARAREIAVGFAAAGVSRTLGLSADEPRTAIPLTLAHLGAGAAALGPRAALRDFPDDHGEEFDFSVYNAADETQRSDEIAPDGVIELDGLTQGGGKRRVLLPGIAPIVTVDSPFEPDVALDAICDTLWIDCDREIVVLVWRGAIRCHDRGRGVKRIVLSLAAGGEERMSALMRGRFGFTVRAGEAPEAWEPQDEGEKAELEQARYGTWIADAPRSRLSLAAYAQISAELAERPKERAATLARHGLDEDAFTVEERGWLELLGKQALDGNAELAESFSNLFVAAQDDLAGEAEKQQTLDHYLPIHHGMTAAEDPEAALAAHELTLSQWLRMQRRWARRAESDAAIARAIEQSELVPAEAAELA